MRNYHRHLTIKFDDNCPKVKRVVFCVKCFCFTLKMFIFGKETLLFFFLSSFDVFLSRLLTVGNPLSIIMKFDLTEKKGTMIECSIKSRIEKDIHVIKNVISLCCSFFFCKSIDATSAVSLRRHCNLSHQSLIRSKKNKTTKRFV